MFLNSYSKPQEIPSILPANGQDWANHTARYLSCNVQINAVLEFNSKLDIDCLKKAVRMSVDAEPVLGCTFIEDPGQACWKRVDDIDSIEWCSLEETDNSNDALLRFVSSTFEPELHQLKIKVIRTGEIDILCVKLNHACTDGGGVKDYLCLLADIYTRLNMDKSYIPMSNSNSRGATADIFRTLGISDPRMAYSPKIAALQPTWAFPSHGGKPQKLSIAIRRLEKDESSKISTYANEKKVTINDMLLTAFYRAMFIMAPQGTTEPMELYVSVDLRRYLPDKKAGAICNLSGAVNSRLGRIEGETFEDTLLRVSAVMNDLKSRNPGLHSAASMELLRTMSYRDAAAALQRIRQKLEDSGKSSPMLSNMGVITQYPFEFGDNTVKDAYIITPAFYPPGFMLGASTYNDVLTVCISYYEPCTHTEDVEKFMDLIEESIRTVID